MEMSPRTSAALGAWLLLKLFAGPNVPNHVEMLDQLPEDGSGSQQLMKATTNAA